jgi:hypothetical protein
MALLLRMAGDNTGKFPEFGNFFFAEKRAQDRRHFLKNFYPKPDRMAIFSP